MYKFKFLMTLFLSLLENGSGSSLKTSCTGRVDDSWNSERVDIFLEIWLKSGVTVDVDNEVTSGVTADVDNGVTSMLFLPFSGQFTEHIAHHNDKKVKDSENEFISLEEIYSSSMPMGSKEALKKYIKNKEFDDDDAVGSDMKNENDDYFNENDRCAVTIGNFIDGLPKGIVWQWKSKRFEDGFLYGLVNDEGIFTGDNITYIYPDLRTGITGIFKNGTLIAGSEVEIIAERCNNGIKEIKFSPVEKSKEVIWKKENLNGTYIGMHPTVRDPFERRGIYLGQSLLPGAGDGVFAKRDFFSGELVSYLSGIKIDKDDMYHSDLTQDELEVAGAYAFGFGASYPAFPEDVHIDIPPRYRHVKDYRTTLGHKVNHNLAGTNTKFEFVRHPSHGPVVALIATEYIAKGQEVYVNYNYRLEFAPQWYKDHHEMVNGAN